MKKKALIKLIDTYIRQLQEIRNDVNSMITEDTADLTQCSNEGAAKYIVSIIKDRSEADIKQIFKEVALRMKLLTGDNLIYPVESTDTEVKTLYYNDICRALTRSDIKYTVEKLDRGRKVAVQNKNGKTLMAYFFDKSDELVDIRFNSYCIERC